MCKHALADQARDTAEKDPCRDKKSRLPGACGCGLGGRSISQESFPTRRIGSIPFKFPQIEDTLLEKGRQLRIERVCRESTSGHRVNRNWELAMIEFRLDWGGKMTRMMKSKQAALRSRLAVVLSVT